MLSALLFLFTAQVDHSAVGLKALEDQKFEAAIEHFGKAVAADPKDFYAYFHLALAHSAIHKDPEAIEHYRKTLELKPGLYQAELNLGMILVENRKSKEAIPLLEDAVRQKPDEFRPAFYLAEAYFAEARFNPAEMVYLAATALDTKSAPAQYGLARAIMKQNRLADAQPHFVKAGQLDAQYRDSVLELASVYEEQKQTDSAVALYKQFN